ncbi:STAS domain-containing protein [Pseudonocardia zijingensis]|jgi:anti-anti-sigma factor|uniref:Anti-sigma factor antagonist n=1 Tax=Pseudonocardia zijingensis TaxID=153376 RepID=A0ABP4AYQ1_9PSEU
MSNGTELPGRHGDPPGAPRPELLRVEVHESRPGVVVVSPFGEVDVSSADLLRDATHEALTTAGRGVVVDLGGVTFCGSTGLVVLIDAQQRADEAGVRFRTAAGPPIVRRVLDITRLGPVLHHSDTVAEALDDLVTGSSV